MKSRRDLQDEQEQARLYDTLRPNEQQRMQMLRDRGLEVRIVASEKNGAILDINIFGKDVTETQRIIREVMDLTSTPGEEYFMHRSLSQALSHAESPATDAPLSGNADSLPTLPIYDHTPLAQPGGMSLLAQMSFIKDNIAHTLEHLQYAIDSLSLQEQQAAKIMSERLLQRFMTSIESARTFLTSPLIENNRNVPSEQFKLLVEITALLGALDFVRDAACEIGMGDEDDEDLLVESILADLEAANMATPRRRPI